MAPLEEPPEHGNYTWENRTRDAVGENDSL